MQPLTRLKLSIVREGIEAFLLVYAAVILFIGYVTGPYSLPVLIAGLGVSVVAILLIAHVIVTMWGYPVVARRVREATGG